MSDISPNVVILTRDELRRRLDREYQRGVERGKYEAGHTDERVSRNCANWKDGRCERCGAQWQHSEVGPDFKCPHFAPRSALDPGAAAEGGGEP